MQLGTASNELRAGAGIISGGTGRFPAALYGGYLIVFVLCTFSIARTGLRAVPSKQVYAPADTVIIALEVTIPAGHYLCGNPLGPGIGRPLEITVVCPDTSVRWLGIRKMAAEKHGPPFGEWIWVYRNATTLFCTGIVSAPVETEHEIRGVFCLRGLVCHTACSMFEEKLPFSLRVGPEAPPCHFTDDTTFAGRYRKAVFTMDLPVGKDIFTPEAEPEALPPVIRMK